MEQDQAAFLIFSGSVSGASTLFHSLLCVWVKELPTAKSMAPTPPSAITPISTFPIIVNSAAPNMVASFWLVVPCCTLAARCLDERSRKYANPLTNILSSENKELKILEAMGTRPEGYRLVPKEIQAV
ncbi:MAG TPA: hypothetical protein VI337_01665 [Nitrospirales bacterium]|nr:hypothetical protein [Nitrospirales bacterium]